MSIKKKAVMILSGGLDSTTLLYKLINEWYEVNAISFFYWQNHSKELECAKKTCEKLWVNHKLVDISFLKDLLKSSLLDWAEAIPEWHYQAENMKATVVPNRNMIFTAIAVWYGQSIGAEIVALWIHNWDHDIYPDCREEFIQKLNDVVEISDRNKISLYYPLINMDKWDIVKIGLELWVDYWLTWTCYKWLEKACGKCWSCVERIEAFEKNWEKDVLNYN